MKHCLEQALGLLLELGVRDGGGDFGLIDGHFLAVSVFILIRAGVVAFGLVLCRILTLRFVRAVVRVHSEVLAGVVDGPSVDIEVETVAVLLAAHRDELAVTIREGIKSGFSTLDDLGYPPVAGSTIDMRDCLGLERDTGLVVALERGWLPVMATYAGGSRLERNAAAWG
jgi:hypothetical protein